MRLSREFKASREPPADLTGTATVTRMGTTRGPLGGKSRAREERRARADRAWFGLKDAVRRASGRVREVVTPAGWLVLGCFVFGVALGLALGWIELLVAGIAAGILLALSLPFLLGGKGYKVSLLVERDRVTVGDPLPTVVRVENVRRSPTLPGTIDLPVGDGLVEVPVPSLRGEKSIDRQVDISTARRGIVDVGPPRVSKGDPLGLLRYERAWTDKRRVYIHPQTVDVPSTSTGFIRDLEGNPAARLVSDDLAFHAIREYAAGDSRRQIHWKSTAKTGQLMVRQYEETRRSEMLIALDIRSFEYLDELEFELAVSAAASLGLRGVKDGRELQVVLGSPQTPFAVPGARGIERLRTVKAQSLLDDMSGVKWHERVSPVAEVVGKATERDDSVSIGVVVTGSQTEPREIRSAALAMPLGVPVLAIVADSMGAPGVQRLGELDVLRIGILEDLRHLLAAGWSRR